MPDLILNPRAAASSPYRFRVNRAFFATLLALLADVSSCFRRQAAGGNRGSRGSSDSTAKFKKYTCDSTSSYSLTPVEDANLGLFFEELLTPEAGAKLGRGRDVAEKRARYDSMQIQGVWEVDSDIDGARFATAQKTGYMEAVKFYQKRGKTAQETKEYAERQLRKGVERLSTEIQKLPHYPKHIQHPTNKRLDDTVTYLLHGTKAEYLHSIMCTGLRASSDGVMGGASYLADSISKADQYSASDCAEDADGKCTYFTETLKSTTTPGFPFVNTSATIDRAKPMNYMLVVLVSPFRGAQNFVAKHRTKGGRHNWNTMFRPLTSDSDSDWVKYPWDNRRKSFVNPKSKRSMFEDFQLVQMFAKAPHPHEADLFLKDSSRVPANDRYDEYLIGDTKYTKVAYIVAYQRYWSRDARTRVETRRPRFTRRGRR